MRMTKRQLRRLIEKTEDAMTDWPRVGTDDLGHLHEKEQELIVTLEKALSIAAEIGHYDAFDDIERLTTRLKSELR